MSLRVLPRAVALAGLLAGGIALAGPPEDADKYDRALFEAVEAHVAANLGQAGQVWHEVTSPDIHIDLLPVPPTENRPFWTVVTAGMSYRPMPLPEGVGPEWQRAELMILVPADWAGDLNREESVDSEAEWAPFRLLKQLARYPHTQGTFLGPGHTVQIGAPVAPGSPMQSALIHWAVALSPEALRATTATGEIINFYAVYPIHEIERQVAVDRGSDVLFDGMLETGAGLVFDPARAPLFEAAQ